MQEQDRISVTKGEEFLTGVFKKENMAIMEWVSDLEGVNGISILCFDLFLNLRWSHSVFVQPIVERDSLRKASCSRDEEVTLCNDGLSLRVIL